MRRLERRAYRHEDGTIVLIADLPMRHNRPDPRGHRYYCVEVRPDRPADLITCAAFTIPPLERAEARGEDTTALREAIRQVTQYRSTLNRALLRGAAAEVPLTALPSRARA